MEEKNKLFGSKLDGTDVEEKVFEENKSNIEQLEDFLAKEEGRDIEKERELYEEEKEKMK